MLWRLVAKLMFKAMLPLIAVAGVFSYGIYMRGGDPSLIWKKLGSGSVERAAAMFSGVQNDASRAVGALSSAAAGESEAGKREHTEVFTWQDADGVTHYSTSAPASITARTLSVDPNVNVVAPVQAPVRVQTEQEWRQSNQSAAGAAHGTNQRGSGQTASHGGARRTGGNTDATDRATVENELGGSLPGIAGHILSGPSGDSTGQGMDPSQLIRMLQSAGN